MTRSRFPGGVRFAAICLPLLAAGCAGPAQDAPGGQADQPPGTADTAAGPEVERNPLRNAYFGDFHVHSSWSLDAYSLGGNRNDPAMAYRFGRGEEVNTADGRVLRLRVPLDFMAVTDHDIWLGTVHLCLDESDAAYDTPTCEQVRANAWFGYGDFESRGRVPADICGQNEPTMSADNKCYERARHQWHEVQRNADTFNEPGRFTTFPAYEWTANPPGFGHLHRNVIFRGDAVPEWGGSSVAMENRPERLWKWLAEACTGDCQVLAIPHNSNLSGGSAFEEYAWIPYTAQTLRLRAWAEPLVEIHQIKGNSECYLGLGATDEECNFENYQPICEPGQRSGCASASDYVRNALKAGLRLEADYGVNPFKFGIIASPDDHQSLAGAADEEEFATRPVKFGTSGGFGMADQGPYGPPWFGDEPDGGNVNNPGGLVGVWAEANTRDAIFDALRRRETFGNSGPRIHVRFFAGWDYPADLDTRRDMIEEAYRRRRADGLRPAGPAHRRRRRRPPLRRLGHEGRRQCESAEGPDRQGLGRDRRALGPVRPVGPADRRAGVRRRLRRRAGARPADAPLRRQRRAGEPVRLQLLDRSGRGGAEHDLDRPGLRPRAAGVLLRAGT